MCEDCEDLGSTNMSYAEKRRLIDAAWQRRPRPGRAFVAAAVRTPPQLELRCRELDLKLEHRPSGEPTKVEPLERNGGGNDEPTAMDD